MDFAKFFLIALFLNIFTFVVTYNFFYEMGLHGGSTENPFGSLSQDLQTIMNPSTGQLNETTFEGMNPTQNQTSSMSILALAESFVSGLQTFFSQIVAGLRILWYIFTAPMQLANLLATNLIEGTGASNTVGLQLIFNSLGVFWVVAQAFGLMQLLRGAKM